VTTGLPTIDMYFSGELLESPNANSHYRERLIRLRVQDAAPRYSRSHLNPYPN